MNALRNILFNSYSVPEVADHPKGRWQYRQVGDHVWLDAQRGVQPSRYARLVCKKSHRYIHRYGQLEWRWHW